MLLTALKPIATLKTSLEANYDGRTTNGQTKRLKGARATALPKKWSTCRVTGPSTRNCEKEYEVKEGEQWRMNILKELVKVSGRA